MFANKYRPKVLDDVVGQETAVKIIKALLNRYNASGQDYKTLFNSIILKGSYGSGKCILGDSIILTENGFEKIEQHATKLDGFTAKKLKIFGKNSWDETSDIFEEDAKETIKITSYLGLELTGTPEHPVYIYNPENCTFSFKKLAEIKENDLICVQRGMTVFGKNREFNYVTQYNKNDSNSQKLKNIPNKLTNKLARLLGYFIANGSYYKDYIQLSSTYPEFWKDVSNIVKPFGISLDWKNIKKDSKVGGVCFGRFIEFLLGSKETARYKKVPELILTGSREIQINFIKALFDCDSWSDKHSVFQYYTASKRLAKELQLMLLNLGIVSIHGTKYLPEYNWNYSSLNINGSELDKLVKTIFNGTNTKSNKYIFNSMNKRRNTNIDVIPGIKQLIIKCVEDLRNELNVNAGGFYTWVDGEKYQFDLGWLRDNPNASASYSWLEKAKILIEYGLKEYNYKPFEKILDRIQEIKKYNFFFSKITKIETSNIPIRVYDFSIPKGHNFFSNGFISHNTTLGRLLARYLNCDNGPLVACGTCTSCLDIDKDRHHDLIEIDAATNRGIADIKELQKLLSYSIREKFRVIIMDEAHQLSNDAWNAQLKTLEESDKRQLFIYATTDAHKIPDTIVSRSLTLTVSVVSAEQAAARLKYVAEAEGLLLEDKVAETIAFFSKGHMRDSLQLLEIASTLADGTSITLDDIYLSSGMKNVANTEQFVNFFYDNDFEGLTLFIKSYLDSSQVLLRSAIMFVHSNITELNTSASNIPLADKLNLLNLLQTARMDFEKHSLMFPFICTYFHTFQNKRTTIQ